MNPIIRRATATYTQTDDTQNRKGYKTVNAEHIYKIVGAPVNGRYKCPLCETYRLHFEITQSGQVLFTCIGGCDYKTLKARLSVPSFADDIRETYWTQKDTHTTGTPNAGWKLAETATWTQELDDYEARNREARYSYEAEKETT